jgi:hypothetical protein
MVQEMDLILNLIPTFEKVVSEAESQIHLYPPFEKVEPKMTYSI